MAISVAVCEIFSVKEWCSFENSVRVRSRSLKMAPFDRSHTSSYSPTIVNMALSCIICEKIGKRKLGNFYTPPVFIVPAEGDFIGISSRCLMLIKLDWLGYHTVKKNYNNMLNRFHLIPVRHGRTDRQNWYISIAHRISLLMHDKNWNVSCHMAEYCHNNCLKCPHMHKDAHATRQLHCQWWSGHCHAKHAANAALVHHCCAPTTDRLAAGWCPHIL